MADHYHSHPLGDWHVRCRDPWAEVEFLRTCLSGVRNYLLGAENATGHAVDSLMALLPDPDDYPDPDDDPALRLDRD